jgi:ArsR family transcriptional regulator, arsenate/arsenite/antimonite-responsive transcriptional repressor
MAIVDTSQSAGRIDRVVHVLEALADRSRLLIVSELSRRPMPVSELVARLPLAQSTISVHLGVLCRSGLVSVAVKRNQRIYSLTGTTALRTIATVRRFITANDQT